MAEHTYTYTSNFNPIVPWSTLQTHQFGISQCWRTHTRMTYFLIIGFRGSPFRASSALRGENEGSECQCRGVNCDLYRRWSTSNRIHTRYEKLPDFSQKLVQKDITSQRYLSPLLFT